MIDALFGSKTRVKLLNLFLNNPGQSFFVREITRKIDEQINSVRRELSNMLEVGIITSDSADNKLFYQVNQRHEHYPALRAIFSDSPIELRLPAENTNSVEFEEYTSIFNDIAGIRIVVLSGIFVKETNGAIDILAIGNVTNSKVKSAIKEIESREGREINYSVLSYDEFYYRLSVRDKFLSEILSGKHRVIIDKDKVLNKESDK